MEKRGRLPPEVGALLVKALQIATEQTNEQEGRCQTEGAVSVSAETARRLTCDQPVLNIAETDHACHHHPNTPCPLNQGRSTRRPGPALQRAVRTRDQGTCQFPGCTHRHHLHQNTHHAPQITPWTPTPTWDGTYPVDYQAAVDWLQHLDSAS